MRTPLLALLTVSLLSFSVRAQITSVRITDVKEVAPIGKIRRWKGLLENLGSNPIAAFHASFRCPSIDHPGKSMSLGTDYDALEQHRILDHVQWIPPNGAVEVTAADPSTCTGGVDAIIHADGRSEGDPRWAIRKRQEWSGIREGVIQSLPLLDKIANRESDLEEVADTLRDRRESIPDDPLDMKKFGEKSVYAQLESVLRVKPQPGSSPHPQPRSEKVNEPDGINVQRMVAYLIDRLQEWKAGVESVSEDSAVAK